MPSRLEITLKPDLFDAEGAAICGKANDYFGLGVESVRTVSILTFDSQLTADQLEAIRTEIFTNPVTQVSSYKPLVIDFDWVLWVGYRPGVRDNPGSTAEEAVQDLLGIRLKPDEAIYTSKRYCLKGGNLSFDDADRIARELLANDIIQEWRVFSKDDWDTKTGAGIIIPKVRLDHKPTVTVIPIDSDETLMSVSKERGLALNPNDVPTIRAYFLREDVLAQRRTLGISDPTDVELEYISQARSDHCNHNTFKGLFHYTDLRTQETRVVDNLFETCIEAPTLAIQK